MRGGISRGRNSCRPRLPAARVSFPPQQPPARPLRRLVRQSHTVARAMSWQRRVGSGPRRTCCSCAFRPPIGPRAGGTLSSPSNSAPTRTAGGGPDRLFVGRERPARQDSGWPRISDGVCRAYPAGSRGAHGCGRPRDQPGPGRPHHSQRAGRPGSAARENCYAILTGRCGPLGNWDSPLLGRCNTCVPGLRVPPLASLLIYLGSRLLCRAARGPCPRGRTLRSMFGLTRACLYCGLEAPTGCRCAAGDVDLTGRQPREASRTIQGRDRTMLHYEPGRRSPMFAAQPAPRRRRDARAAGLSRLVLSSPRRSTQRRRAATLRPAPKGEAARVCAGY